MELDDARNWVKDRATTLPYTREMWMKCVVTVWSFNLPTHIRERVACLQYRKCVIRKWVQLNANLST